MKIPITKTRKYWIFLITMIIAISTLFSTAMADSQLGQNYSNPAQGVPFNGKSGAPQTYVKKNNTIVYLSTNSMIYITKNDETESLFPSLNNFFISGNQIIAYDGSNGDSKGVWNSYDIKTGKTTTLSNKYLGNFASIFWSNDLGVYYTKNGENTTYYYQFNTGKETLIGKSPGEPCGIIDGKIISISFANNRISASKDGKHTVLYKGTKDFRSATVINDTIYITTTDGLYQLNKNQKKPIRIFKQYAVVVPMSGDMAFVIMNDDNNNSGLMGDVELFMINKQKYVSLTKANGNNIGGGALLNPYLNEEGTALIFNHDTEITVEIPPYSSWKQLPIK